MEVSLGFQCLVYQFYVFGLVYQVDKFTLSDPIVTDGDITCLSDVILDISLLPVWFRDWKYLLCNWQTTLSGRNIKFLFTLLISLLSCLCHVSLGVFLPLSACIYRFSSTSGTFIFVSIFLCLLTTLAFSAIFVFLIFFIFIVLICFLFIFFLYLFVYI